MSNKLFSPDQQKDTTSRRRRLLENFFKPRANQGDQHERDGDSPRSRSSSSLLRFRKSPDPKIGEAKDAQPAIKTGAKIPAAGPTRDNDMWKIAEDKLRQDAQKRGILEQYDRILEEYFKSKLEPVGTLERREQFLGFLNSKIEQLDDKNSETQLKKYSIEARRLFKTAFDRVIATKDIINGAAGPCLPASVACAGVMFLLLVC